MRIQWVGGKLRRGSLVHRANVYQHMGVPPPFLYHVKHLTTINWCFRERRIAGSFKSDNQFPDETGAEPLVGKDSFAVTYLQWLPEPDKIQKIMDRVAIWIKNEQLKSFEAGKVVW